MPRCTVSPCFRYRCRPPDAGTRAAPCSLRVTPFFSTAVSRAPIPRNNCERRKGSDKPSTGSRKGATPGEGAFTKVNRHWKFNYQTRRRLLRRRPSLYLMSVAPGAARETRDESFGRAEYDLGSTVHRPHGFSLYFDISYLGLSTRERTCSSVARVTVIRLSAATPFKRRIRA